MKKWILPAIIITTLALPLGTFAGCTPASEGQKETRLDMVGSTMGSSGYIWAAALAKLLNTYSSLKVSARSGAPVATLIQVEKGDVKVGLTNAPSWIEVKGQPTPENIAKSRARTVIAAFNMPQIDVVAKNSPYSYYEDIPRGSQWNVGPKGSGSIPLRMLMIELMGKKPEDFKLTYLSSGAAQDAWREGKLDVNQASGGQPHPTLIQAYASPQGAKVLTWKNPENYKKLVVEADKQLGYAGWVIPKRLHPVFTEDTNVVAMWYYLAVRDDFPEDVAYTMLKVADEHYDELVGIYAPSVDTTPKNLVSSEFKGTPIHPGAVRYLKEKGYLK